MRSYNIFDASIIFMAIISYRRAGVLQDRKCWDWPAWPYCIHICSVCNLHNESHIGIVVVVAASWDFNKLVSHTNMLCIDAHVFWSGHCNQLNSSLIAKCLISPAAYTPHELDSSNPIVGYQHAAQHCKFVSHVARNKLEHNNSDVRGKSICSFSTVQTTCHKYHFINYLPRR